MFRQSAPWLKESPRYNPPENDWADCSPAVHSALHAAKHGWSGRNETYQFGISNTVHAKEAPKRRLCKNDFKCLRRYQNYRMRMASACKFVMIAVLASGWLIPVYMVSHPAVVLAIAHKCSTAIQSALASQALKSWIGKVYAA